MAEKTGQADRFNWRLPIYAGLSALILCTPLIIKGDILLIMLYVFVVAPIVGFFILITAILKKGRQRLAVLSMLVVYCAVSWGLFMSAGRLHPIARWFLWSKDYRAEVLAQPDPGNGTLKHIEWDAWGFPGAGNTTVYLVFDPNDSLSAAAKTHSRGKFRGLPCEVARVRRMESQYYSVLFYTDSDWSHCP